ncbi:mycofactocin-coupled SDR family oxidoreductase [Actinomycetospora flava]|uniref:Mycofactocin-coupled SDR family oxidoreductase n=1 Tax=Actinomycetospora flava TaxID=3129232 RepID=A0ABU8MAG6_9PSEU
MGRMDGKVAFITGAARGQGRRHAERLAQEGADIIAVDLCEDLDTIPYSSATPDDLAETVRLVEHLDRRIVAHRADVRDLDGLRSAVADGLAQLGRIDVVCANAGVANFAPALELTEQQWDEVISIDLTGVWKTVRAAAPAVIEGGRGGSVILTSSIAGLMAYPNLAAYVAAKHGVVGLMRALATELAPHRIRVNSIHPSNVDTPMIDNDLVRGFFTGQERATRDQAAQGMQSINALPLPWAEVDDISNAVVYLASDESRYVTGSMMTIDAGATLPFKLPHVS